ncbi:HSP20-like chaperone [Lasiosphaeria ovina]|uniref:HSP20-like chaperone n=1 Tax=Lasiosphaeria ovina TaxID=92902 RepID=A0AAE0N0B1_9PEZI|nr:HSP20-like chaperone [Lasiosphaeria ovina]
MSLWYPYSYSHSAVPGFSSLFRMLDEFDKYAQQQIGTSIGGKSDQTFSPKFDVTEHDKEYQLQGELPGVPPENVVVDFTDNQALVVRGHAERKHTEGDPSLGQIEGGAETKKIEGGGKKSQLSERSYGEFSRVFSFPVAVDQDKIQTKFEHGILDVKVPKAESNKGRRKIPLQ